MDPAGYFCLTSDRRVAGFVEEECFSTLVFRHCYQTQKKIAPNDPLGDLFRESALRSYFVLRLPSTKLSDQAPHLLFYRFDEEGFEISHKLIELKKHETRFLHREPSLLYRLASRTLFDEAERPLERFLLIRRINSEFPEEILLDEPFAHLSETMRHIAAKLAEG
jgi:hypothetical protein